MLISHIIEIGDQMRRKWKEKIFSFLRICLVIIIIIVLLYIMSDDFGPRTPYNEQPNKTEKSVNNQ